MPSERHLGNSTYLISDWAQHDAKVARRKEIIVSVYLALCTKNVIRKETFFCQALSTAVNELKPICAFIVKMKILWLPRLVFHPVAK